VVVLIIHTYNGYRIVFGADYNSRRMSVVGVVTAYFTIICVLVPTLIKILYGVNIGLKLRLFDTFDLRVWSENNDESSFPETQSYATKRKLSFDFESFDRRASSRHYRHSLSCVSWCNLSNFLFRKLIRKICICAFSILFNLPMSSFSLNIAVTTHYDLSAWQTKQKKTCIIYNFVFNFAENLSWQNCCRF